MCRRQPAWRNDTKMIFRGTKCAPIRQSDLPLVIPAQAGIQRGGEGKCSAVEDYARRGACPPLGPGAWAWQNPPSRVRRLKPATPDFHPLACRRQPARSIGTKMAFLLASSNSSSFVSGKEECSAGACPPLGPGAGNGRIPCANSPHEPATPGFHTLVCRAQAGMSDCYENRPHRRPLVRDPRHPIVNPAPTSSFRRRPESKRGGDGKCSPVEDYARRGACPPLASGWAVAESVVPFVVMIPLDR